LVTFTPQPATLISPPTVYIDFLGTIWHPGTIYLADLWPV